MLNIPRLQTAQIEAFKRDGFVAVRNAFDAAALAQVDRWCQELLALPEESGKHWVFRETSRLDASRQLIARIEKMSPYHAGFAELVDALKAPVGQLLGDEAVLFKEKLNFKMPGGDGFKPHQDSQAGWEAYARFFITVILSIDEATVENGCLQVAAGHHDSGLFRAWEPLSQTDMSGMRFIDCPTKPGDLVFLGSYTPHASEPNLTQQMRRLLLITYNRRSEGDHMQRYYADKHRNYPPDIDRLPGKEYVFRV